MVPGNPHPTTAHARWQFTRRASAHGLQPARWANSFEVNRVPLQEAKPRQPTCARGLSSLAGLVLVGRCRRHCDCTIGTQWPKSHLRRLPPMRRPTLATNSTPADVAVLPVPHAWGQKQQASASGERMGKYAPGARPREGFSGNHGRPAHKLRLSTLAGTVKSRLGGGFSRNCRSFPRGQSCRDRRSSVEVEPGDTSLAGRAEA